LLGRLTAFTKMAGAMPLPLTELFPDEDYRFHLTLRKGDAAEFFRTADAEALAERSRWLADGGGDYARVMPDGEALVDELATLAREWGHDFSGEGGNAEARLLELGRGLDPDFMLLREEAPGEFRLQAGVVCFPSSWNPAEKFGLGLDAIHGVVPRLNPSLGGAIGQFLQKLKPGVAFERANWGLATTAERNMHPKRSGVRLGLPVEVDRVWVRIEDQLLAAMPATKGILFGIKLRIIPLKEMLSDVALRRGLRRALETMPADVAVYKGLGEVRGALVNMLRE
jgi:hypothetical protein